VQRPVVPLATRRRYDQIAEQLGARAGVQASSMFGMPTLKLDGKALAGIYGAAMVFKLAGDAHTEAPGLPGRISSTRRAWDDR
jgi:hypothetical protein